MNNTLVVYEKAKKAIEKYSMLKKGDRVIVGLSGGADSVCLLHFLNSIKEELNLTIVAAHINHGIRGEEAEKDALFSNDFSNKLNIQFELLNADCIKEAEKTGETVEEAGRRIRYDFFKSLANTENSVIATAHNSNDNMETIIFNITRGSSLNGAKGIPPIRENIIRPLIFCTREEIEDYCKENSLSFVTDSTNLSDDYTRNKIRHLVIPELKTLNNNVEEAFSRFAESVRDDADFFEKSTLEAFKKAEIEKNTYSVEILNSFHISIKNRVIYKAINDFCGEKPDSKKIKSLLECTRDNTKIQLYKHCYAQTKNGVLKIFDSEKKIVKNRERIVFDSLEFNCQFGQYTIETEILENISQKIKDLLLDNLIDCDTICGNLVLRTRQEGDKITLNKRNVTKTLKKLFIEDNVSKEKRDVIPVIADDNGVVWVFGFGVNKKNTKTKESKNILSVRVSEKNGFTKNE